MALKEIYRVSTNSTREINNVLGRLMDRLDKLEGFRGIPEFQADVSLEGNQLTEVADGVEDDDGIALSQLFEIPQPLDVTDNPTFKDIIVSGLTADRIVFTDLITKLISADSDVTSDELESLTDDSMVDSLHRHSELSASDGTPNPALFVDTDGNVAIDSDTEGLLLGDGQDSKLYYDGSRTILVSTLSGTLVLTGSQADSANKQAVLATLAWDTDQIPFTFFLAGGLQAGNLVLFGGGASGAQAATQIDFYTAAAVNTETGTKRITIKGDGKVGIGVENPGTKLEVGGVTDGIITIKNTGVDSSSQLILQNDVQDWRIATRGSGNDGFQVINITGGVTIPLHVSIGDLVGIDTTSPTLRLSVKEKSGISDIGGFCIKLTNQTGGNTVQGQLVKADTANNDAVILTGATDDECFGVFLESGVADGSEAWVVVAGIADVRFDDNVAAVRGNWVGTGQAGLARTQAAPPALGIAAHFEEIGHSIESVAAGGGGTFILARCVLHFN